MRSASLLAAIVVVIAFAGCNSNKSTEEPSGSSGGGLLSRASNMVGGLDAFSAFMKANAAKEKATSYRMKMEMSAQGQSMTSLTEVQCPDKMHSVSDFMGRKMENYRIGNTMYSSATGSWKSINMPVSWDCHGHATAPNGSKVEVTPGPGTRSKDPSDDVTKKLEEAKDQYTFTKGDVITVEGDPCQQYTISSKNPAETKMKSMTFCVGTKDDLLRQMKTEGMTMTYYDWNKDLGIKAPI